ncbi:MAG: hypothetical protein KDA88_14175 [Planctomycetaceae bacterium]|nr:hypothetical protein [Planctomycetaceae bacterium]MCB9951990.1 hypothetical protein [Planctomycetaceae bacterium]
MAILLAKASPLTALFVSLLGAALSVAMVLGGRHAIKTRSAKAAGLERLFAGDDGKIHGGGAVLKGYILMLGGILLGLMCLFVFGISLYELTIGPINPAG